MLQCIVFSSERQISFIACFDSDHLRSGSLAYCVEEGSGTVNPGKLVCFQLLIFTMCVGGRLPDTYYEFANHTLDHRERLWHYLQTMFS